ncbi:MAG: glutathione S-transferase family protein [Myxococcota bacterium]
MELYYHPSSRAGTAVLMLEAVHQPYTLKLLDLQAGEQKQDSVVARNRMGKIPLLVDGDAVVSEVAAIGMYLADRYAPGTLAPALDDPRRGTYFRWCVYPSAVLEMSCYAETAGWKFSESSAGFGNHQAMLQTVEDAVTGTDWLLGDQFTMADIIFGATLRFMLIFKMIEERDAFKSYVARFGEHPAITSGDAVNNEWRGKLSEK